ncbi:hypothetical protein PIPA1_24030 [Pelosinus sp. IPA-1]|nr:hypothetical protein PIPA1_24030 [Pelosinus sp. IPA-1]
MCLDQCLEKNDVKVVGYALLYAQKKYLELGRMLIVGGIFLPHA